MIFVSLGERRSREANSMASTSIQTHCFFPIETFDGTNHFRRWQESMLLRLRTLGIAHVLSNPRPSSTDAAKQWDRDDALCRGHILHTLADRVFDLHVHRSTAKDIWNALRNTYGVEADTSFLRFTRFVMVDDEPILEQVAKFQALASDVNSRGEILSEMFLVEKLISKLPPSWSEPQFDLMVKMSDMSMDELCRRIRLHEAHNRYMKEVDEEEEEVWGSEEGVDKREKARCEALSLRKKIGKKRRAGGCFNCGKSGHIARFCRQPNQTTSSSFQSTGAPGDFSF